MIATANGDGHSVVLTKCPFDGETSVSRPRTDGTTRTVTAQLAATYAYGDGHPVVMTKCPFDGEVTASRTGADCIIRFVTVQPERGRKATGTASYERDARAGVPRFETPGNGERSTPSPAIQDRWAGTGGNRTRGTTVLEAVVSEPPNRPSIRSITRSDLLGKCAA